MMSKAEEKQTISEASDVMLCNLEYVGYLRTIIKSIKALSENQDNIEQIRKLSELGCYLADDFYNLIDCDLEKFVDILKNIKEEV